MEGTHQENLELVQRRERLIHVRPSALEAVVFAWDAPQRKRRGAQNLGHQTTKPPACPPPPGVGGIPPAC